MSFKVFPSGPFATNCYLLYCPETKEAALIDAPPDSFETVKNQIDKNNLNPKYLLFTHSHWDHIADASKFLKQYPLISAIHPLDAPNLQQPGIDKLPTWLDIEGVSPKQLLAEGDCISIGNLKAHVIHTPGHTPGGVCFYLPEQQLLFSGDTLFKGTIGNLSFPTANPELMWQSLQKIAKLPKETVVLPGHGGRTSIGEEPWLSRAEELFG
jgi:hydroxyacylglutathione hydrolase